MLSSRVSDLTMLKAERVRPRPRREQQRSASAQGHTCRCWPVSEGHRAREDRAQDSGPSLE